jgi:hypothetical protein
VYIGLWLANDLGVGCGVFGWLIVVMSTHLGLIALRPIRSGGPGVPPT